MRTAFVPTMGALHAGHAALISRARTLSDDVVVSIFVNPLQFENKDDLAKYPKSLDADREIALAAGATRVWAPTYEEIYPAGEITKISAGPLGSMYEGASRAGHFDGVLTVVNRLFNIVKPHYAIFGEKDFQQLTIIKNWVRDCAIPVEIIAVPTVRDSDGVALSSRNARLTEHDRDVASLIPRALTAAIADRSIESGLAVLAQADELSVDYLTYVDETSLLPTSLDAAGRFLFAGWINGVRLLDNMGMPEQRG